MKFSHSTHYNPRQLLGNAMHEDEMNKTVTKKIAWSAILGAD